jgi:CHAT domain
MSSMGSRAAFPNTLPPRPLYPQTAADCCATRVGAQMAGSARQNIAPAPAVGPAPSKKTPFEYGSGPQPSRQRRRANYFQPPRSLEPLIFVQQLQGQNCRSTRRFSIVVARLAARWLHRCGIRCAVRVSEWPAQPALGLVVQLAQVVQQCSLERPNQSDGPVGALACEGAPRNTRKQYRADSNRAAQPPDAAGDRQATDGAAPATVVQLQTTTAAKLRQIQMPTAHTATWATKPRARSVARAEALSGLARAFFYAGARSLVVSHWDVDSAATVKLMDGLFAALKADPGLSHAEALPKSMLQMIANPEWAQPSLWAPFVIVGEPKK